MTVFAQNHFLNATLIYHDSKLPTQWLSSDENHAVWRVLTYSLYTLNTFCFILDFSNWFIFLIIRVGMINMLIEYTVECLCFVCCT